MEDIFETAELNLSGTTIVLIINFIIYLARHWYSTLHASSHINLQQLYVLGTIIIIINFTEQETEAYN